jgi:ElaB/YqjD/DUF883 family membrane-anchored ribosome-binding protein
MEPNTSVASIEPEEVTKEKLVNDLKAVARDAEDLIKATAGDFGEKAKAARARLAIALENAKATYQKLQEKAVAGAKATDKCIREHPYQSIGVAFALGLVIGLLINKNK